MSDHFAAFSFVDRITGLVPGTRARGSFAIPAGIAAFPPCLIAEAVGQLAAWVAMSHIEFRGRPVAALARETRFVRAAQPGETLDLAVEIEDCDDDAVAYRGWADIGGERAIELADCLGPMLPTAEFDDPKAMRERFAVLADGGAAPGRFRGVDLPRATREGGVPGTSAQGTLAVPVSAAFFNDHFPRRPVFPATLMLDAQIALALELARESSNWPAGTPLAAVRMTHVKVRSFTPPGAQLGLGAEMRPVSDGEATVMLSAHAEGKSVATARVVIKERTPQ
jgi:3-hydroxymyristoyl/3-hydroxydecanoyl-(acyl carrier protein) dehydratase